MKPSANLDYEAASRGHPGRRIVSSARAGVRSAQAVALMRQAEHPLRDHHRGGFADGLARGGAIALCVDD